MPDRFVFPPRITVASSAMRPMVDDPWAAFCDHRRAARRTTTLPSGEGFGSSIVDECILQNGPLGVVRAGGSDRSVGYATLVRDDSWSLFVLQGCRLYG